VNVNVLKAERFTHFQAAEKLIKAAREAGKDLVGADLEQYQGHITEIRNIDAQMDRSSAIVATQRDRSMPDGPRVVNPVALPSQAAEPAVGRDYAIFNKGESIAEHMRQQGADVDPEVNLGSIVRAMALGGGSHAVRAALAEGTDSAGGFTVPTLLQGQFIDALRARSVAYQAGARGVLLETGKPTTIAQILTDPTAAWRAENADVAVSDMTFGAVSFSPKSLAVIVVASQELLEDSLNVNEALTRSLTASLGGELDRVALIGAGSGSEPKGVSKFTGVGSYSMGTNGAALANYDPFVEALAILQAANAQDPTACIIAPRTAKAINLLKTTTNEPLPRPDAIANLPFLVTSRLPINETQGGSNAASRAIMGYYPDLLIGIRTNLRIELLREKYADKLQYGIRAFLRADIAVAHAASFCNVVGIL